MRIHPPPPPEAFEPWRRAWARVRDAWTFGERISPPVVWGGDLVHRIVVLLVVAALTASALALLAMPGVAVIGKTVGGVARRFSGPIELTELPRIAQRSVVLARDGEVLATLAGEENRVSVPLAEVPKHAQNAVLAIEDAKFYEHEGVDLSGLVRATLFNFRAGRLSQGGSTITQQLVKNTLVGSERSIDRKIREARLAVRLEASMSKREILELYLNETYFGEGVYGIGTAAEYYFGKHVRKLTVAESALLAGIIKAPERYGPLEDAKAARARRHLVLKRMVDERFLTQSEAARAHATPLGAKRHPLPEPESPYFVEYVKQQILDDERFGETRAERAAALFGAGLRIQTTLDVDLQDAARRATEAVLNRRSDPASALVSMDVSTGAVRAMVGGRDFADEKYNLAVQGKRQPGSTFKPVVLAAALDGGIPPTYTMDTPSPLELSDASGKPYVVQNYSERGEGFMDMRRATELSVNTYYVQLIDKIGPRKVVEMGEKLGIASELKPFLSLALGSIEVSPFELTNAYATLANNGVRCRPLTIVRVTDAEGRTILANEPDCERTVAAPVAAAANDILRGVPIRGTGRENGRIGRPNAAKTGTTNDLTDAWYAGYTPQLATVVWIGYPDSNQRPLRNIHGYDEVFGGTLPARIWARFMRAAHRGLRVRDFAEPPPVPSAEVPDVVGKDVEEAKQVLEDAGFSVRITSVRSARAKGTIVAQDPGGGESVAAGSLVTLEVSSGEATNSPAGSPSPEPRRKGRAGDG